MSDISADTVARTFVTHWIARSEFRQRSRPIVGVSLISPLSRPHRPPWYNADTDNVVSSRLQRTRRAPA